MNADAFALFSFITFEWFLSGDGTGKWAFLLYIVLFSPVFPYSFQSYSTLHDNYGAHYFLNLQRKMQENNDFLGSSVLLPLPFILLLTLLNISAYVCFCCSCSHLQYTYYFPILKEVLFMCHLRVCDPRCVYACLCVIGRGKKSTGVKDYIFL